MASGFKKKGPAHRRRKPKPHDNNSPCPTGKTRFHDIDHARRALALVDQTRMHQPTRIYHCNRCTGYHFTSKNYLRSGKPGRRQ